jgi:hypothetical protein
MRRDTTLPPNATLGDDRGCRRREHSATGQPRARCEAGGERKRTAVGRVWSAADAWFGPYLAHCRVRLVSTASKRGLSELLAKQVPAYVTLRRTRIMSRGAHRARIRSQQRCILGRNRFACTGSATRGCPTCSAR